MRFIDNHHFFDWAKLIERIWRARIAKNPKTQRAEESLRKFHAQEPINLAKRRIERARRRA